MTQPTPPLAFSPPPNPAAPDPVGPPPGWRPAEEHMQQDYAALAGQAVEQSAAPEPPAQGSYTDRLRAERQTADQSESQPPVGAELLRDPLDLDWDERADVMAALDDMQPVIEAMQHQQQGRGGGSVVELDLMAAFRGKPSEAVRFVARMVRAMTPLAHDPEQFRVWAKHATQQQIGDLYSYMQEGMSLGEN